ncbi:hypothetical protein J6590_010134 [Homalodisca vitripennis]|nr:hypothetical protein J6590_010134 [Homalodisca vitripennis]
MVIVSSRALDAACCSVCEPGSGYCLKFSLSTGIWMLPAAPYMNQILNAAYCSAIVISNSKPGLSAIPIRSVGWCIA